MILKPYYDNSIETFAKRWKYPLNTSSGVFQSEQELIDHFKQHPTEAIAVDDANL